MLGRTLVMKKNIRNATLDGQACLSTPPTPPPAPPPQPYLPSPTHTRLTSEAALSALVTLDIDQHSGSSPSAFTHTRHSLSTKASSCIKFDSEHTFSIPTFSFNVKPKCICNPALSCSYAISLYSESSLNRSTIGSTLGGAFREVVGLGS